MRNRPTNTTAKSKSRCNQSLVKSIANKLSICSKDFPLCKTMLRHMDSVHNPVKVFSCSTCNQRFTRKDILERHIAEQHTMDNRFTICTLCGRCAFRRAFKEHLDSQVCKSSRALVGNVRLDTLGYLFPDEDRDCSFWRYEL